MHAGRDATWRWQRASGRCCTPYGWWADRHSSSNALRWQIARRWWDRAYAAHDMFVSVAQARAAAPYPAWFASSMVCIGIHEEGGQNSTAGYFGFIYPPSSYGESGYGDSWLAWPRSAQVAVAWHLYERYGWQPWSTAGVCGLA